MKKLIDAAFIKQFISYFCVGGVAAIVEWIMFYLFNNISEINYIPATVLAFIFSTTVNWILGRIFTFRNSTKYQNKKMKEMLLVFIVSAVGLGFNVLLMYVFVNLLGMNTELLRTGAKVLATGIVFIWNFLARRIGIYGK